MNSTALTLILISVFLHATWNFLCKKDKPTMGFFLVFSLSIFSVMLPFLLLSGINPLDMKKVYAPDDYREKLMQRALLQYYIPENADMVRKALKKAHREDLIGNVPDCLVLVAVYPVQYGIQ